MSDVQITWLQSVEEARDFIRGKTMNVSLLAFDTETTGLEVRNGKAVPRIVQFSWRPWKEAIVVEVNEEFSDFIDYMFGTFDQVVGHNTKFDMHAMATAGFNTYDYFAPEKVHDTMWLARLKDERTSAKLKDLATRYLRAEAADFQKDLKRKMRDNGWDWDSVPIKYLVEYGGYDAILTGELFDFLYPQIEYAAEAYRREQLLSPVLFKMERRGLHIDHDLLNETTTEYEKIVTEKRARLEEIAPGLNPNSPKQIRDRLQERGIIIPNTQAVTLAQIDDEFPKVLLDYREHNKSLTTYLQPWQELIKPTGRLHPWFNQLGTKTGRFSSSDPNLQNITRGHVLRDIFSAPEGSKMVVADWNQMELRLYAHFAEDQNMIAAFLSGDDIYQQAADLLGVPRQVGKMIMLASIYGAGPRTIKRQCVTMAIQFDMPDLLAEIESYDWGELYSDFHKQYKIKHLAKMCELAARKRHMYDEPYIRTWGGRRQRPKLVLSKKEINGRRREIALYKDLANSLVQGSSADLMKQALIDVDKAGAGEYLRLTVHDEMVAEVPDAEVEEVKRLMERTMTRNEFVPPLTAEAQSAQRYGDAK